MRQTDSLKQIWHKVDLSGADVDHDRLISDRDLFTMLSALKLNDRAFGVGYAVFETPAHSYIS